MNETGIWFSVLSFVAGIIVTFMFLIPNEPSPRVDPYAAYCRGWIDAYAMMEVRTSGMPVNTAQRDVAEGQCADSWSSGVEFPGVRGPILP